VFLIDNNQPEPGKRHQDRGPCPQQHSSSARQEVVPLGFPGTGGETAMPYGQMRAKAPAEDGFELEGEGDFRDQDERSQVLLQGAFDQAQIDLALAAPGHAMEHKGLERRLDEMRPDRIQDLLLIGGKIE